MSYILNEEFFDNIDDEITLTDDDNSISQMKSCFTFYICIQEWAIAKKNIIKYQNRLSELLDSLFVDHGDVIEHNKGNRDKDGFTWVYSFDVYDEVDRMLFEKASAYIKKLVYSVSKMISNLDCHFSIRFSKDNNVASKFVVVERDDIYCIDIAPLLGIVIDEHELSIREKINGYGEFHPSWILKQFFYDNLELLKVKWVGRCYFDTSMFRSFKATIDYDDVIELLHKQTYGETHFICCKMGYNYSTSENGYITAAEYDDPKTFNVQPKYMTLLNDFYKQKTKNITQEDVACMWIEHDDKAYFYTMYICLNHAILDFAVCTIGLFIAIEYDKLNLLKRYVKKNLLKSKKWK